MLKSSVLQNFSSEHKLQGNFEIDLKRRFYQNYSANKICKQPSMGVIEEQEPDVDIEQYTSNKSVTVTVRSFHSSQQKMLEKFQPSVDRQESLVGQKVITDKKSVFNKIDINSISVRKFNLDICEEPHA